MRVRHEKPAAKAELSDFRKLVERVFPKMGWISSACSCEQCATWARTAGDLVEFMETGDQAIGGAVIHPPGRARGR